MNDFKNTAVFARQTRGYLVGGGRHCCKGGRVIFFGQPRVEAPALAAPGSGRAL